MGPRKSTDPKSNLHHVVTKEITISDNSEPYLWSQGHEQAPEGHLPMLSSDYFQRQHYYNYMPYSFGHFRFNPQTFGMEPTNYPPGNQRTNNGQAHHGKGHSQSGEGAGQEEMSEDHHMYNHWQPHNYLPGSGPFRFNPHTMQMEPVASWSGYAGQYQGHPGKYPGSRAEGAPNDNVGKVSEEDNERTSRKGRWEDRQGLQAPTEYVQTKIINNIIKESQFEESSSKNHKDLSSSGQTSNVKPSLKKNISLTRANSALSQNSSIQGQSLERQTPVNREACKGGRLRSDDNLETNKIQKEQKQEAEDQDVKRRQYSAKSFDNYGISKAQTLQQNSDCYSNDQGKYSTGGYGFNDSNTDKVKSSDTETQARNKSNSTQSHNSNGKLSNEQNARHNAAHRSNYGPNRYDLDNKNNDGPNSVDPDISQGTDSKNNDRQSSYDTDASKNNEQSSLASYSKKNDEQNKPGINNNDRQNAHGTDFKNHVGPNSESYGLDNKKNDGKTSADTDTKTNTRTSRGTDTKKNGQTPHDIGTKNYDEPTSSSSNTKENNAQTSLDTDILNAQASLDTYTKCNAQTSRDTDTKENDGQTSDNVKNERQTSGGTHTKNNDGQILHGTDTKHNDGQFSPGTDSNKNDGKTLHYQENKKNHGQTIQEKNRQKLNDIQNEQNEQDYKGREKDGQREKEEQISKSPNSQWRDENKASIPCTGKNESVSALHKNQDKSKYPESEKYDENKSINLKESTAYKDNGQGSSTCNKDENILRRPPITNNYAHTSEVPRTYNNDGHRSSGPTNDSDDRELPSYSNSRHRSREPPCHDNDGHKSRVPPTHDNDGHRSRVTPTHDYDRHRSRVQPTHDNKENRSREAPTNDNDGHRSRVTPTHDYDGHRSRLTPTHDKKENRSRETPNHDNDRHRSRVTPSHDYDGQRSRVPPTHDYDGHRSRVPPTHDYDRHRSRVPPTHDNKQNRYTETPTNDNEGKRSRETPTHANDGQRSRVPPTHDYDGHRFRVTPTHDNDGHRARATPTNANDGNRSRVQPTRENEGNRSRETPSHANDGQRYRVTPYHDNDRQRSRVPPTRKHDRYSSSGPGIRGNNGILSRNSNKDLESDGIMQNTLTISKIESEDQKIKKPPQAVNEELTRKNNEMNDNNIKQIASHRQDSRVCNTVNPNRQQNSDKVKQQKNKEPIIARKEETGEKSSARVLSSGMSIHSDMSAKADTEAHKKGPTLQNETPSEHLLQNKAGRQTNDRDNGSIGGGERPVNGVIPNENVPAMSSQGPMSLTGSYRTPFKPSEKRDVKIPENGQSNTFVKNPATSSKSSVAADSGKHEQLVIDGGQERIPSRRRGSNGDLSRDKSQMSQVPGTPSMTLPSMPEPDAASIQASDSISQGGMGSDIRSVSRLTQNPDTARAPSRISNGQDLNSLRSQSRVHKDSNWDETENSLDKNQVSQPERAASDRGSRLGSLPGVSTKSTHGSRRGSLLRTIPELARLPDEKSCQASIINGPFTHQDKNVEAVAESCAASVRAVDFEPGASVTSVERTMNKYRFKQMKT